jgi:hypothetical protein
LLIVLAKYDSDWLPADGNVPGHCG